MTQTTSTTTLADVIDIRETKVTIDGRNGRIMGRSSATKGAVFMVDTLRVKRYDLTTPITVR